MTATTQVPSVFSFQSANVRAFADESGEPWFLGNDICSVLGYVNPRDAISKHCRAGGVAKRDTPTESGIQEMTFINEGNLYRLIIKSRKPEAEAFEREVMEVILPTIRKTGSFSAQPALPHHITTEQQGILSALLADRFPEGKDRPYAWSRFNNHFRLSSYKNLPAAKFDEACDYIQTLPAKAQPPTEKPSLGRSIREEIRKAISEAIPPQPSQSLAPPHGRYLMSFDEFGKSHMQAIPDNACVLTPEQMLKAIHDPNGFMMLDTAVLVDFALATIKRLGQRCEKVAPASSLPADVESTILSQYQMGDQKRLAQDLGIHASTAAIILRRLRRASELHQSNSTTPKKGATK